MLTPLLVNYSISYFKIDSVSGKTVYNAVVASQYAPKLPVHTSYVIAPSTLRFFLTELNTAYETILP